jgi:serine/threonine-protein kinase
MLNLLDRLERALSDRYAIQRELGAGGMATVYLARDLKHDRDVALKVLRPDVAASVGSGRFLHEIRIAARLQHPNILPVHDSGEAAGFLYYVMPYIDGPTLRKRLLEEGGELPIPDVVRILRDVADAVAAAHAQGVVHRDLKPENVMLSGRHALVADFGVAKAVSGAKGERRLTTAGVTLGTPAYMAPEQASGDAQTDHRADIYALGVLAYEMLTGDPPFVRSSPRALLAAQVTEAPVPVTERRETVPPALAALVMRCLAKKPADRPQRTEELLPALEGLAWTPGTGLAPAEARPVDLTRLGTPTVAVLPFANLSASPEDEYFSDGMTEDVIARLSLVRTLRVISRTSVMRYRKPAASMKSIAAELGASHVVEGSVRRAGNRVRIVAQLIEAEADTHLWASTFDRDITDVFAIQSDVAESISGALCRELSPDERRRLARRPTQDHEAYQLYLLARHHWNSATPEGFVKAEELCEQAIRRDPGFAKPWAAVAVANTWHMGGYFGVRPRDAARRIETYARRALELDPDLAEAHMMLSFGPFCRYEWEAARHPLERALALNPNLPEAHLYYANYMVATGRVADALEAVERAYELDPAAEIVHVWVNWLLHIVRRYDEALSGVERAEAQFGPGMLTVVRAQILVALGRADEAVLAMRRMCQGSADSTLNRTVLAWALAAAAREEEARELLRELHDREKTEYVWPIGLACTYAKLGELDPAFAYLEKGYEDGVGWMQILYGPPFDPFRGDPRFDDLIRRVGVSPLSGVDMHTASV